MHDIKINLGILALFNGFNKGEWFASKLLNSNIYDMIIVENKLELELCQAQVEVKILTFWSGGCMWWWGG